MLCAGSPCTETSPERDLPQAAQRGRGPADTAAAETAAGTRGGRGRGANGHLLALAREKTPRQGRAAASSALCYPPGLSVTTGTFSLDAESTHTAATHPKGPV